MTSVDTASDGTYTLAGVAGGTYTVQFDPDKAVVSSTTVRVVRRALIRSRSRRARP